MSESKLLSLKNQIIRDKQQQALHDSSAFYLRLVSIIVSLALGFFLTELNTAKLFGQDTELVYWLKCISIMQLLVLVWYEYMIGTILFKWILNHFDAAIPFTLGACLYSIIKLLNNTSLSLWFLSLAVFFLLAFFASLNQFIRSKNVPENRDVFAVIGNAHRSVFFYEIFCCTSFLCWYFLFEWHTFSQIYCNLFMALSSLMLLGFALGDHFIFWRKVFLHGPE